MLKKPELESHSSLGTEQVVQPSLAAKKEFTTNLIGWILQGGVVLSSIVILIGLFMIEV